VKAHGRVTGVFGNDARAQLAEPVAEMETYPPRAATRLPAYWSDTVPLRVLHVEAHKKGNSDGHPSLR